MDNVSYANMLINNIKKQVSLPEYGMLAKINGMIQGILKKKITDEIEFKTEIGAVLNHLTCMNSDVTDRILSKSLLTLAQQSV